jgi:hypothetical protein
MTKTRSIASAVALLLALVPHAARACPNCPNLGPPLAEQIATSDAAVLVTWLSSEKGDVDRGLPGRTVYQVKSILRDKAGDLKAGQKITVDRPRTGEPGQQFLLMALNEGPLDWNDPLPMNDLAAAYLRDAPSPETPVRERLSFYLQHLDSTDPIIANDAFSEFAASRYEDVVAVSSEVTAEKVRSWLADPLCDPLRIGFYGMLLGIVGGPREAEYLKTRILEDAQEYRAGVDGMICGYLLISGADGLDVIDAAKLEDSEAASSETYAALSALRFLWTYAPERISKDRLRASMRVILDRPDLADLVIADLARWEDWTVMDRLLEIYADEQNSVPAVKRAVVRYLLAAERARPKDPAAAAPRHVEKATEHLARLRAADPKTVREAERQFLIQ